MATIRSIGQAAALSLVAVASPSVAQNVQVNGLSDVSFGSISGFGADLTRSQSICAFSGLLGGRYTVTASGSGTGGAFTLANGAARLPYEVQWSTSAGQTSGTNLAANVPLAGQTMLLSCPVLQTTNASLIVILRSTALSAATAGSYSGTLTVILSAN
ncbi:spore coat protein U domain-containing protein [Sphingomonas sp. BK345]|uniref:spore coat protein U domain-containing protein n=1 Tax=Sphingomonas sp. BK345 TaxID=2586980 RepID=UPI00161659D1|nr:hypothetical protein [Sphingomonas sp. BK345]MBB3472913.1 hypothetical protein [Sphingomonas sp. BK345]